MTARASAAPGRVTPPKAGLERRGLSPPARCCRAQRCRGGRATRASPPTPCRAARCGRDARAPGKCSVPNAPTAWERRRLRRHLSARRDAGGEGANACAIAIPGALPTRASRPRLAPPNAMLPGSAWTAACPALQHRGLRRRAGGDARAPGQFAPSARRGAAHLPGTRASPPASCLSTRCRYGGKGRPRHARQRWRLWKRAGETPALPGSSRLRRGGAAPARQAFDSEFPGQGADSRIGICLYGSDTSGGRRFRLRRTHYYDVRRTIPPPAIRCRGRFTGAQAI